MKKYLLPLFVMVILAAAFTSCKPDEEIYNPNCKISKIWYRSNSDWDHPNERYVYDSKDKLLQEIIVDSAYSFKFTYNKDNTVSQIVHVDEYYTETVALQWTDRLLDKMTYTIDGIVEAEYIFHRHTDKKDPAKGRIDYIETFANTGFYDSLFINPKTSKYPLFMKVFGYDKDLVEAAVKSGSKDLVTYSIRRLTYDPGKHKNYENISQYVDELPISKTVIAHTYNYDLESYNPFYGLPFAYAGVSGYYLNLPVKEHVETYVANNLSKVVDYTYNYEGLHYMNDKHYPREFVTISSETNVPRHTYILYKK